MNSELLCNICMGAINMTPKCGEVHSISVCGHFFHSFCLQQWIGKCPAGLKLVCPSCKRSFSSDNVVPLIFSYPGDEEAGQMSTLESEDDRMKHVLLTCNKCKKCKKKEKLVRSLRKAIVKVIKELEMTKTDFKKLLKVVKKAEKLLEKD
ncbi:E3 ubiquitin-protein ligase TRAIP-like [Dioscorea cayenensis subsp. rotundata]|uniref:E3 ubiquitin-protein ligase TRAIP-like n=1 Tax=Dioscorea cayennensis subsp. rotundata TaxID=55577 RepID=A0AB40AQK4_DIOCR|nr:E3 ubiquitin-protein ligase TRAIP-like [Dioscorea cayenensis subsp. rotundata]